MEEQLIKLKTAKLAKEKGFNWECRNYYNQKDNRIHNVVSRDYNSIIYKEAKDYEKCEYHSAPTQSLLAKWLREERGVHVQAHPIINFKWGFSTFRTDESLLYAQATGYIGEEYEGKTYEEAFEAGLKRALKLIE